MEEILHCLPGKGKQRDRSLQSLNLPLGNNVNPFDVLWLASGTSFPCGPKCNETSQQTLPGGVFPCRSPSRTSTVDSSLSVNGHMSAQLCILKACAYYFSQCHFVILTNCFHCADTPLFLFFYFAWIYFSRTSIYILQKCSITHAREE